MVRKLTIALGAVVVLAAATVGVWKLSDRESRPGSLVETRGEGTRLASTDGSFEVVVSDTGISWRSPTGSISINSTGVTLKSSAALNLQAGSTLGVQGAVVRLCGSGGQPVARMADQTAPFWFPAPPGPGVTQPAPITTGSQTVLAC